MHQRRETADKVDAYFSGRPLQRQRQRRIIIRLAGRRHNGNGRHRNAFIDDGDTEFALNIAAHLHQVTGAAGDFLINFFSAGMDIRIGTIQQRNAHGNRADIQVLLIQHLDGLQNFIGVQHNSPQMRCIASKISSR